MVNESEYRSDYFPTAQHGARDLPRPTFSRAQDVRGGNVKHVRAIAWSSDGRHVATGGEYKELIVWDTKTSMDAKSSFTLPSSSKLSFHNGHVGAIAWSPIDSNVLVSGDRSSSSGGTVAIWDITSPSSPIATFKIPGDVLHIAFHPSGKQFAVVCPKSRDEVFFFWKTNSNSDSDEEKWVQRDDIGLGGPSVDIGSEEINSLRYTNSGKLVCAVSNDGSINAWLYPATVRIRDQQSSPPRLQTKIQSIEIDISEEGVVASGSSSPKAANDEDAPVTGKSRVGSREGTPEAEAEAEDGGREGKEDVEMTEQEGEVITETQTDTTIEQVATQVEVPAIDVEMTDSQAQAQDTAEPILTSISAAPSRQPSPPPAPQESSKSSEDTKRNKQLLRFRHAICHSASLLSLSFDPRGKYLAVGGQDALLSVFDTRDWICERTFDVCTAAIRHSAFSYDGEYIAFGGDDSFIAIVSIYSGAVVAKVPVMGTVNSIAWHPRRNWMAYSTTSKVAPVWHVVHQEQ